MNNRRQDTGGAPGDSAPLSRREREVASLVCEGLQNKEIAAVLGTAIDTVKKQTVSIYQKMGVSGRVQLVALLMQQKA